MFLIVGGEGSSNRNASRDESVEAGDKSVEARDESIEAGEKTPQSCYNMHHIHDVTKPLMTLRGPWLLRRCFKPGFGDHRKQSIYEFN